MSKRTRLRLHIREDLFGFTVTASNRLKRPSHFTRLCPLPPRQQLLWDKLTDGKPQFQRLCCRRVLWRHSAYSRGSSGGLRAALRHGLLKLTMTEINHELLEVEWG